MNFILINEHNMRSVCVLKFIQSLVQKLSFNTPFNGITPSSGLTVTKMELIVKPSVKLLYTPCGTNIIDIIS